MLQYDFQQSLGYWIFSTAHEMTRAMNEELSAHGITFRQWELLACLSFCGAVTQSELAEKMRIEAPTLVGMLDRMERDGWIQRVPDERDRRKKLIRPTEQVEPVWAKMVACAMRVRERAKQDIPVENVDNLRETLEAMRANLAGSKGEIPDSALGAACRAAMEREFGNAINEEPIDELNVTNR